MKYITIFLFILLATTFTQAQEQEAIKPGKAKHFNLIKVGASLQADMSPGYGYHGYDSYYYPYSYAQENKYPEGPNTVTFVAYEHIWEFPNKVAVAVEPKIGISFREYYETLFAGNDMKLYWANRETWRMGIALSADYYYGRHSGYVVLQMDDGNYQQRMNVDMYDHYLNFDLSIIPFQFRAQNVPLVFEMQFSMIGMGVYFQRSAEYQYLDGTTDRINRRNAYPYFFKTEFKIGFVLP